MRATIFSTIYSSNEFLSKRHVQFGGPDELLRKMSGPPAHELSNLIMFLGSNMALKKGTLNLSKRGLVLGKQADSVSLVSINAEGYLAIPAFINCAISGNV